MIDTIYSDPDFLMHHGVKGMKWGVRRYQNEDGSLTPEGSKHYNNWKKSKSLSENVNKEVNKLIKSDKRLSSDFGKASNIDDEELFDLALQEYGIKSSSYDEACKTAREFNIKNRESISEGHKIATKIMKDQSPASKSKEEAISSLVALAGADIGRQILKSHATMHPSAVNKGLYYFSLMNEGAAFYTAVDDISKYRNSI